MKKSIFVLFIFCVSVFSGCKLDREEFDKLDESLFYKNEKDCKAAMANLYNFLSGGHGGWVNGIRVGGFIFSEMTTDIMDCYWSWDMLRNHNYNPSLATEYANGGEMDLFAITRYLTICRGTMLRINNADIPKAVKDKYIAEAKTIYAYIALHLYKFIGPVPITPDEDIFDPLNVKYYERPTDSEFVKMIVDNVLEAMPNLSKPNEQDPSSEWGRMNTGIARMILVKLYMIEKDWVNAKKYAKEIVDMNYYKLEDSYMGIFAVANKRNKEEIYGVPRDAGVPSQGNTWHANSLPNLFPTGNISVVKWGGYSIQWDFVHTFNSKDKRLGGIVTEFVGTDGKLYNEKNPGAPLRKGAVALKYDIDPAQVGSSSNHDIIIYRYADVLLSMAEAINELEGPTLEALDYFNKIRPRTGLDNMLLPLTKEAFRDSIFKERGHEFYCEGSRYADMVRMGKFVDWMKKTNPAVNPSMIRFPIADKYITEYQGKLKQNPGY
jgi:SusD family.